MDLEDWERLFGSCQDEPALKAAFAAAGVKKKVKLDEEETSIQIELKGHGLELILTDEATLKQSTDLDVGEGALILSGVIANVGTSHGKDSYKGKLPCGVSLDMKQDAIRKIFGNPTSTGARHPVDVWVRERDEVIARYAKDSLMLTAFGMTLPGVEF